MPVRVRYAPSPTGSPHIGNLRTAIYNWLLSRKEGGQFIARLEDTNRSPDVYFPEGIYDIEASLRFLGMMPDESWFIGGPYAPYVQSQRLPSYQEAAEKLIEEGTAYRCYCSRERLDMIRKTQQDEGKPTGYDRHCRTPDRREKMRQQEISKLGLEAGQEPPSVVRLAMPQEGVTEVHDVIRGKISYENKLQDDQVLLKSDGFPTYFFAAPLDDIAMKITHILRGDDWLSSAAKFAHVFKVLHHEPPIFAHLPLITGRDKRKLGKRHGSTRFVDFIEMGYLPEALINFLCLLGWSAGDENRELFTVPELIERFSLGGITESPAVFDYDKLNWMNGQYIRASEPGRIIGMCLPYLRKAGLIPELPGELATDEEKETYRVEVLEYVRRVIPLEIERMKILSEVVELVGPFFLPLDYPNGYDPKAIAKWMTAPHLKPLLEKAIADYSALPDWTPDALETATRAISEALQVKFAEVIHPVRVAATGRTVGPGLFETLWALGRDRTLARLKTVLERT